MRRVNTVLRSPALRGLALRLTRLVTFPRRHTPCSVPSLLKKPAPHSVLSRGSLGTAVCLAVCLSRRCRKRPDDPGSSCDGSAASSHFSLGCRSVCRQSLSAKTGFLTGGIWEAEERLLWVVEPSEVQGRGLSLLAGLGASRRSLKHLAPTFKLLLPFFLAAFRSPPSPF